MFPFERVTFIVFTKDRADYLKNLLQFYLPKNACFIIADASEGHETKEVVSLFIKKGNASKRVKKQVKSSITYFSCGKGAPLAERGLRIANSLTEEIKEFCVFLNDDDLVSELGVLKAIRRLDHEPEFIGVYNRRNFFNTWLSNSSSKRFSYLAQSSPLHRLRSSFNGCDEVWMALIRKQAVIAALKIAGEGSHLYVPTESRLEGGDRLEADTWAISVVLALLYQGKFLRQRETLYFKRSFGADPDPSFTQRRLLLGHNKLQEEYAHEIFTAFTRNIEIEVPNELLIILIDFFHHYFLQNSKQDYKPTKSKRMFEKIDIYAHRFFDWAERGGDGIFSEIWLKFRLLSFGWLPAKLVSYSDKGVETVIDYKITKQR